MSNEKNELMDKIISLCKRRGFIFPGSEIYGGLANSWDYGPLGVELQKNIKNLWWKYFVHGRDDMVGLDAALIMNPKVWEASGHLKEFSDPLVECKKCHTRYRADQMPEKCEQCKGKEFTAAKQFNLMLKTFLGPAEDSSSLAYLRGEIAQSMFVDFKNVLDTMRKKIPFGIASQGKAFRNEITPGNFIFRTREFNLMEFEYFVKESEWETWFEYWRKEMLLWLKEIGADMKKVHEHEIPTEELAHYSRRTIDFEFDYPFGRKELYGLAYRTDFDLKNHMEKSGQDLQYTDAETNETFIPHVIEPTFGLDRSLLVVLLSAYHEEEERIVLKLKPALAPYKAAVFPLLKNKPELVKKAQDIYRNLQKDFNVAFDDRGNIGKRYYSQDEIGTPWCITVDFETLEKDDVTVRDRDTMKQERVKVNKLKEYLKHEQPIS
ncbi:MAG: glycine--tRNA ligase [Candidatus Staskawiczbacteria bacterium RIFCSPLOWO2_01_FULL_40_39]|uniref:Glycine--tRNA ligase n=1 Tax=Candidatus Staskawiczbacteria bacterium RIFCSPHIGHO2_01_FULL_39_25 TaxID=1802202 RepID=A0A1G2HPB3_9BACT|nr:MAG: glycine--tRNA ligase [Candidatus Staskawiczbacteria bacterium RIFCSPHIGHO2_01_FULL_39_25]OGZ73906.1 MAG: glycine--tRNA ligase [Candidatus Staskawiczbacteria bacterium RIFCSPLOWO2_01_FULL_40_39]